MNEMLKHIRSLSFLKLYGIFLGIIWLNTPCLAQPVWHTSDQQDNTAQNSTSWSVNVPTNLSAGNLILLVLSTQESASTDVTGFTVPTGFIKIVHEHDASSTSRPEVAAFYKISDGTETGTFSGTVTNNGSSPRWKAVVTRITNFDPSSPIGDIKEANSGSSSVQSLTLPAVNRTAVSSLVVAIRNVRRSTSSDNVPTGMTAQFSLDGNGGNDGNNRNCDFQGATQTYTTTGSTGNKTFTWSGDARSAGVMFVINGCNAITTPTFILGSSSTRCKSAGTVTYSASSTNASSIVYSLNSTSLAAGNTINSSTGQVTYTNTFSGTSTITATAYGCGGPLTATHTVTTTSFEAYPLYGTVHQRCQESEARSYGIYTSNADSVVYTLDNESIITGLFINRDIGSIEFPYTYADTAIVTATAYGCGTSIEIIQTIYTDNLVVEDDKMNLEQDEIGVINVLSNDDCDIDVNTLSISTPPVNGTALVNTSTGEITYTPNASYGGLDSLTYRICRTQNPTVCETAKVYFNVINTFIDNYFNFTSSNCQRVLNDLSDFDVIQKYETTENISLYTNPLVADLDGDGDVEIVVMSSTNLSTSSPRSSQNIRIFDGTTGAFQRLINTPFMSWEGPTPICLGDLDGDGDVEIIIASLYTRNGTSDQKFLYCYDHLGNQLWKSNSTYGAHVTNGSASALGLADFNGDGIPEVYVYNEIFNALTGVKLCSGGANGTATNRTKNTVEVALPVAANLRPANGLELACGRTVYEVNITNTAGTTGNSMTAINFSTSSTKDGFTALADINLDGDLDVIVMPNDAQLYVWNPRTNSLLASYNSGSGERGTLFVGDVDGNGTPDIGYCRPNAVDMVAYNGTSTLSLLWTLSTTDGSGRTGLTMFDFNQDGTQELIYRDESLLRILDGSGGSPITLQSFAATSTTGVEGPIVADVDNDGEADILVTSDGTTSDGDYHGMVVVFQSDQNAWAPARKVWNQFGYYNVHIKDDYTIPASQPDHGDSLFSDNSRCPESFNVRPLNAFNVQSTIFSDQGCPVAYLPDMEVSIESIEYVESTEVLNINYVLINKSDATSIPAGVNISFFVGNPLKTNATLVATVQTANEIPAYSKSPSTNVQISDIQNYSEIYAIANTDGSTASPFSFPLEGIEECNYSNNSVAFFAYEGSPLPIELTEFLAFREYDKVRVSWKTSIEINASHFYVQRSSDGEKFTNIGRVEARGNSTTESSYLLFDDQPLSGLSYYRLYQVDLDGRYDISEVNTVLFEEDQIQVYPNPAVDYFQVYNPIEDGRMQLINPQGLLIGDYELKKGSSEINVISLPCGVYYLRISLSNGSNYSKTLIKK
jgi:hypothetical protein